MVNIGIVILTLCCLVIVSTAPGEVLFVKVGSAAEPSQLPDIVFYIAGCLIGASGAALQAASRTLLVDQVPPEKVTEAFGLYALSGKATTFVGPLLIAWVTGWFDSQRVGVSPVIVLLLVGYGAAALCAQRPFQITSRPMLSAGNGACRSAPWQCRHRSRPLTTSSSRIEPPGWMTAVAPASTAERSPSAKGKNASDATTDPFVRGCGSPIASAASCALRAAMREESTRLICPAPIPTVAPSRA